MNSGCSGSRFLAPPLSAALLLGALLAGCGRNDVQVYRVAKEEQAAQAPAAQPMPTDTLPPRTVDASAAPARPQWKTPSDWKEMPPGEMRVGSFKAASADGKQQADISIVPLGGGGGDLDNVNRWRGFVGLGPISASELAKQAQTVEIGGLPAQLYDQAGQNPSSGEKQRIVAAIQRRDGTAWFFKMAGDDELVEQQKATFIEFLKSVTFTAAMAQPELPPSHPPTGGAGASVVPETAAAFLQPHPDWQVPSGWQEVTPGPMVLAKYQVAGSDNSQAAVSVSTLAGDGGGLFGNVTRWRRQIGLPPLSEDEVSKLVSSLDVPGGKAVLVDMTGANDAGQKTRLIGVVVPRSGETWFYKLMGSQSVVEKQKDVFAKFVQSVKYPQ